MYLPRGMPNLSTYLLMMKLIHFHNYLFFIGFFYYLIIPIIIVSHNILSDISSVQWIYKYYDSDYLFSYCTILILLFCSFYIGSFLPLLNLRVSHHYNLPKTKDIDKITILLIFLPLYIYGQYLIILNRHNLFQGYSIEYDTDFLGKIATLNSICLFLFLYIKSTKDNNNSFTDKLLLFAIIEFSIVLLGLGSRMYVLIPIISILIYLIDKRIINAKKICLNISILIFVLLFVGFWRSGGETLNYEIFLFICLAESLLTWISAVSMFSMSSIPFFAFPYNYLSSFINFIPSAVLIDKAEYIKGINIDYDTPFGATNILVSILSNFGIIGSCFMLFIGGFILTVLRINSRTPFYKTYYYCVCAILPFQLFRDDFTILNKMILFNFLIFPSILLFMKKIIKTNLLIRK